MKHRSICLSCFQMHVNVPAQPHPCPACASRDIQFNARVQHKKKPRLKQLSGGECHDCGQVELARFNYMRRAICGVCVTKRMVSGL
jgi:predicted RNA-binding Zn-ribbon protein involved in translation (DUF1610 family)